MSDEFDNEDGWIEESDDVVEVTAERDPLEHPTPTELKHAEYDRSLDEPRPGIVPWGLTMRQWTFIMEYLKDFNALASARRAGYKKDNSTAYRLLKHPVIRKALEDILDERAQMYATDHSRIIQELCAIGYFDLGDAVSWGNGSIARLKSSTKLRPAIRRCIKSVTETISAKGDRKLQIEAHSKIQALTILAQAVGLVRDPRMSDRAIAQANKAVAGELDRLSSKVVDVAIELSGKYIDDAQKADEFVTTLVERLDGVKHEYEDALQGEIDVVALPEGKEDE